MRRCNERLIDIRCLRVNAGDLMEADETFPRRSGDLLSELGRQDLDPFSVAELEARIAALEAEIARTRSHMDGAVQHRASAEALFRR